jgi:hypothetical protein
MMQVDQDIFNAPARQHIQDMPQRRFAPERHHGLGCVQAQGQHAGSKPGRQDDSFAGKRYWRMCFHGALNLQACGMNEKK